MPGLERISFAISRGLYCSSCVTTRQFCEALIKITFFFVSPKAVDFMRAGKWQLKELRILYCANGGSSVGVRGKQKRKARKER